MTDSSSSSPSILIDRTTLWDNSVQDDDRLREKCVAALTDQVWQSVGALKDLVEQKYVLHPSRVRRNENRIDEENVFADQRNNRWKSI